MKTKFFPGAVVILSLVIGITTIQSNTAHKDINLSNVESITACELPDGYSANGHCVSNDANEHFCATPGMLQSKDCYQ